MAQIIPLPDDRTSDKLPVHIETTPEAFPERLRIRLDWNYVMERWVFEVEHVSLDERVIKSMVSPYFPYWYRSFLFFTFIDPSGKFDVVTPENLGDDVRLFAFAGPEGFSEG